MKVLQKYFTLFIVWLRWCYFHLHPNYVKFYMNADEAHFQNVKTGKIYSNYYWID